LQIAFAPHGDGLHGSLGTSAGGGSEIGVGLQAINGSPVYPSLHLHTGLWEITLQKALIPQEPGQGSIHLSLTQAKLPKHSAFIVHSGLQQGGRPI
jgi:hypothetical protein